MVFTSTDGYFEWFEDLNPGTFSNTSQTSIKIDLRMGGLRVRGTISCPAET